MENDGDEIFVAVHELTQKMLQTLNVRLPVDYICENVTEINCIIELKNQNEYTVLIFSFKQFFLKLSSYKSKIPSNPLIIIL